MSVKSASAPIRPWSGAAWPHQQTRSQPRARRAGRGGLGCRQSARPAASFFLRIGRGHQIAAVAVGTQARCALLAFAQQGCEGDSALVASKIRAMQLQAGQPARKGNKRGATYAHNVKELRDREIDVALTPNMPTNSSSADGSRVVPKNGARVPPMRSDSDGCAAGLTSSRPALCHAVTRPRPK